MICSHFFFWAIFSFICINVRNAIHILEVNLCPCVDFIALWFSFYIVSLLPISLSTMFISMSPRDKSSFRSCTHNPSAFYNRQLQNTMNILRRERGLYFGKHFSPRRICLLITMILQEMLPFKQLFSHLNRSRTLQRSCSVFQSVMPCSIFVIRMNKNHASLCWWSDIQTILRINKSARKRKSSVLFSTLCKDSYFFLILNSLMLISPKVFHRKVAYWNACLWIYVYSFPKEMILVNF